MAHLAPQLVLSSNHLGRGLGVLVHRMSVFPRRQRRREEMVGGALGRHGEVQGGAFWATRAGSSFGMLWGATEGYRKGRSTMRRLVFRGVQRGGQGGGILLQVPPEVERVSPGLGYYEAGSQEHMGLPYPGGLAHKVLVAAGLKQQRGQTLAQV